MDGITVDGPEDQENFQKFLDANPDFRVAMLERVRGRQAERDAYNLSKEHPDVLERMRLMQAIINAPRSADGRAVSAPVSNPMRMTQAIDAFVESKRNSTENGARTLQNKKRLLPAETVLRAYSATGTPLTGEFVLPLQSLGLPTLVVDRGRLLLSWIGPAPGYAVQYGSVDPATGTLTARTLVDNLPSSNSFVTPLLLDTGGALLWPAALGTGTSQTSTAGVRLDASFTALQNGPDLASALVAGLPTYFSDGARAIALGPRLVFATRDGSSNGVARVTWFDPVATAPLTEAALSAISFEVGVGLQPMTQAVYSDRTLVFSGDGYRLRSTLVWLNDGKSR